MVMIEDGEFEMENEIEREKKKIGGWVLQQSRGGGGLQGNTSNWAGFC